VVDMEHMLFCIPSENFHTTMYNVSLNTHFCDCPSRISNCKHILGVERIVKEYFLPSQVIESIVESFEAIIIENDVHNKGVMSPIRLYAPNVDINNDSFKKIDLTRELLNMFEEAQIKFQ
jgi:hypothetical protein